VAVSIARQVRHRAAAGAIDNTRDRSAAHYQKPAVWTERCDGPVRTVRFQSGRADQSSCACIEQSHRAPGAGRCDARTVRAEREDLSPGSTEAFAMFLEDLPPEGRPGKDAEESRDSDLAIDRPRKANGGHGQERRLDQPISGVAVREPRLRLVPPRLGVVSLAGRLVAR
jgi:hypothetical protein